MTVEVGVVRGNFERVQNELADLLVQLRVKTNNPQKLVALETQLGAINVRAETFLKALGMVDDEEVSDQADLNEINNSGSGKDDGSTENQSEDNDSESIFPKSDDQPTDNSMAVSDNSVTDRSVNSDNDDLALLAQNFNHQIETLTITINQQSQLLAQLVTRIESGNPAKSEPETEFEQIMHQYLSIGIQDIASADIEYGGTMIQAINQAEPERLLNNLAIIMNKLGENVMQPSVVLLSYFKKLAQSSLTNQQKTVMNRLIEYQQNSLRRVQLNNPLPSPWNRGMKELFE